MSNKRSIEWSFAKQKVKQDISNPIIVFLSLIVVLVNFLMPGRLYFKIIMAVILIVPQTVLTIVNYPFPKNFSHYLAFNTIQTFSVALLITQLSQLQLTNKSLM